MHWAEVLQSMKRLVRAAKGEGVGARGAGLGNEEKKKNRNQKVEPSICGACVCLLASLVF